MRAYNKEFGALNASNQKEPRFAIHIAMGGGTDLWIVSHDDVTIGSGTTLNARVETVRAVSQRLRPLEGRAEIGALSFSAVDVGQAISDKLRTELLTNSRGVLGKTVKLYVGDSRIAIGSYELESTQVLQSCTMSHSGGKYEFRCRDVQRAEREDILDPVETRLTANVTDTATTITVADTSEFDSLDHGTSFTDAPSATGVIYFKIDKEIIRTLATDVTATTFVNCVRGVLGTRAASHTTDEDAATSPDRGKKVTEVIYLEMPIPKMIYALQTGALINQGGTLPAHWHAAMSSGDVKLTEYTAIGADLYDPADDTAGVVFRFVDPGKQDAKRFIEQDLLRPGGMFQPVLADGQLGLRRLRRIIEGAAASVWIDDSVLLAAPMLTYVGEDIANEIELSWNEVDGELTRSIVVQDASSITRYGQRTRQSFEAKGLHGSRHSRDTVVSILQQAFDRRAGPPIRTTVQVQGSMSFLEVGDVIRLKTDHARDWTGANVLLDRPFEIQGKRTDWRRNRITLNLEASSLVSDPLAPIADDEAIADAWFTAAGTDISGEAGVTDEGSYYEIGADLSLAGNVSMTAAGAVYYADKDLTIAAGITLTINDNVQLRVLGTLTVNGTIDGAGNGLAGVSDTLSTAAIPSYPGTRNPTDVTFQSGQAGGFGSTQAHGGLIERVRQESVGSKFHGILQSVAAPITAGAYDVMPLFQLDYRSSDVHGLPGDLRGTSGGPGGLRYFEDSEPSPNLIEVNIGGAGGAGGAGLVCVTRGFAFGASGKIDTTGDDGSVGAYDAGDDQPAHAGAGAGGAPGGILIIVDGNLNAAPSALTGKVLANYGSSPLPSSTYNALPRSLVIDEKFLFGTDIPDDRFTRDLSVSSGVDATFAASRVMFMPPGRAAAEDQEDEAIAVAESIGLAVVEAYSTVTDGAITRLTATITETATTAAYSHANVYVRTNGTGAWTLLGGAEPALTFDLPADNASLEFVAVAVLSNLLEAPFSSRSNLVSVTVTDGAVGVSVGNVTGLVSGQNLLPAVAAVEQAFSGQFASIRSIMIADIGLEVGDVFSYSADVRSVAGVDSVDIRVEQYSSGGFVATSNAPATGASYQRVSNSTIVAATVDELRVFGFSPSTSETHYIRRQMLHLGGAVLPFEEPPGRVNRGELELGADVTGDHAGDIDVLLTVNAPAEARADVTANNGQTPAWLTALVASGDINASSVEAVLNAVNMVNGVREAGATSGVIATATGATDGDLTSVSAASFIEAATATLVLDATRTVEVTFSGWLRSAGASSTFCRVKALRDAAEIGGLSGNNIYIAGTAMTPFIHVYQATIAAGTYVFSWQFKKDAWRAGGNIIARSRRVSARIIR